MTRIVKIPLPLLLASLLVGCSTCAPPDVVCPTGVGNAVSMCSIAASDLVVEATVEAWASQSRVLDLEGYPDTVFTPVALRISRALKGSASGRLDVLMVGCVSGDGSSIQGPLQTVAGKSEGYFFIVPADGYNIVVNQGFFRREDGLLKNAGVASEGITESEFATQTACGDSEQ